MTVAKRIADALGWMCPCGFESRIPYRPHVCYNGGRKGK